MGGVQLTYPTSAAGTAHLISSPNLNADPRFFFCAAYEAPHEDDEAQRGIDRVLEITQITLKPEAYI